MLKIIVAVKRQFKGKPLKSMSKETINPDLITEKGDL